MRKKILRIFVCLLLVAGMLPPAPFSAYAAGETKGESGIWFESAYAAWTGPADEYRAFVRTLGAKDWRDGSSITGWLEGWTEVDGELVRETDPSRDIWRVDIPGLPMGEYEIQVRAESGAVLFSYTGLETRAFPREGAAFVPSNTPNDLPEGGGTWVPAHDFALDGAVGGYLPDGRVNPEADIIYVTHDNMAETLPSAEAVFGAGREGGANAKTPLVIRFLGTVGSFTHDNPSMGRTDAEIPPAVSGGILSVGDGNGNVTFEGIGSDAAITGWGISNTNAHNVVIRNLAIVDFDTDGVFLRGGTNLWVHNNTFGYGNNRYLASTTEDPDQAKGDGACDISNNARNYTVSYNHFAGSSKAMLIGGGATSEAIHYGTVHHNWFDGTEERTPRVRNGRVHVFNNLFENIQGHAYHNEIYGQNTGYGIGAGHNANVWAEGNIFDNVNFPMLRSRQGHSRGFEAADYVYNSERLAFPGVAGAEDIFENEANNAGKNHFFGDAPGYIISREAVTGGQAYGAPDGGTVKDGDFPRTLSGFRAETDYLPGLTQAALDSLREAAAALQPNIIIDKGSTHFDPSLDIGITVAADSSTVNPNMSTNPASMLDWKFRPTLVNNIWGTETDGQVEALRAEIEGFAGTMPKLAPKEVPAAPEITGAVINGRYSHDVGQGNGQVPNASDRIIVYENTFTIKWAGSDPLTETYELEWDQGTGDWETLMDWKAIAGMASSARDKSFITQRIDQFATPQTAEVLAAAEEDKVYAFRIRAVNAVGASDWSSAVSLDGNTDRQTVTFDSLGGNEIASRNVISGSKITGMPRPVSTDPNQVFVGWFTDKETSGHMWDALNDTVDRPVTLYAKWVMVDSSHLLLNAYATPQELENPYVGATLRDLGVYIESTGTLALRDGTTVYVAPGVYWTTDDHKMGFPYDNSGYVINRDTGLTILGANLNFIGLTSSAADAIICGNRGEGGATGLGYTGSWYALDIPTGFHGENFTVANYAQEDLVYPRDPSQNWPMRINSKNHAEVLSGTGDRFYFENMRFVGYLNMMMDFIPERAYFKDSFFQCTDDSIFSGDINVYENCTFNFYGNHPTWYSSNTIAVLLGCEIVGMPQMTGTDLYFAKTAGETNAYAIIDTNFSGRIETVEWENSVGDNVRHFVSNNTIGNETKEPLAISPSKPQTSVDLAGLDALEAFKVGDEYNVYNLLKGTDGWDPKSQNDAEWADYTNLPFKLRVAAEAAVLYSEKDGEGNQAILTPSFAPADSADLNEGVWIYDEGLLEGSVGEDGVLTLVAKPNDTHTILETIATFELPNGLSAGASITIYPLPITTVPTVSNTVISMEEGIAALGYEMGEAGLTDVSTIEWYRESGSAATDGVHIGTNRVGGEFTDAPYKDYALSKYDVGSYLRAVITPMYEFGTVSGDPVTVYTDRAVTEEDLTGSGLFTDFKNLYITNEANTTTGRWFFDRIEGEAIPWAWSLGTNGAGGKYGLQNNSGSANTLFVFGQTGRYGDMTFTLDYSPGKVEGQGFGGNGNYMDIYVKYNPVTRSGYGLRAERSNVSSNATTWTLYKYDGDTQTALGEGMLNCAFMPQSTITVSVEGNTLSVRGTTLSARTPLQTDQALPNVVELSWTDESGALTGNTYGGFGIRINNSGNSNITGGSGTNNCVMLHSVAVEAETK